MSNKIDKISALGKKILDSIGNQRLTKKYVYGKMGISRGTLDNWISGETAPTHLELNEMSKILNIDLTSEHPQTKNFGNEGEPITMELWLQLKKNNDKFQQEIDRLWSLIDRMHLPGDGIKSITPKNR